MKISDQGLELIKKFEGLRLQAYKDPVGILTIGYGHTRHVTLGQKITKAQAEAFLKEDLQAAETKVMQLDYKYHWQQHEFDALVSFCYNVGSITALTKFGTRSRKQIAEKMLLYVKAGGKTLKGLENRRKAEHEMFCTPNLSSSVFEVGKTYKVQVSGLLVRKAPTTEAAKAQKNALKKGSNIVCEAVEIDTDGNIWIKHSKGYSAAIYKGSYYIK